MSLPRTMTEAKQSREEILSLIALELRENNADGKPRCCWGAVCFVTCTSKNYWCFEPTGRSASRIEHLGLSTYRRRKPDRANLDSFETLRSIACSCERRCHEVTMAILQARYSEICACRSQRDENIVLARLMWDDVGRRTGLCDGFFSRWLGLSTYRLSVLKITVESALESGIDLRCGVAFLEKDTGGHAWLLGATENDGRGGSGRTPQRVVELVTQHFHTFTRTLPGQAFRRCVRADVDGLNPLWRAFEREAPDAAAEISVSTFRSLLSESLKTEGLLELQGLINDHNADKVEKATTYAIDRAHHDEMKARIGGDRLGAEEFARRKIKLEESLKKHRARRYRIRAFQSENIAFGRALLEAQRQRFDGIPNSGGADAAFRCDARFNSLPIGHFSHEDDMSSLNEPMFKLEHQGMGLERYTRAVHGSCDIQRNWMHFYLPDLGFGSKNASSVMDEVILDLLENLNGEQFVVLYMDCASLNQNCWVALGLPQLLVDLKICSCVILVFFWQNDSKDGSDRGFGKLHLTLERSCVVGAEMVAEAAERSQTSEGGLGATARIVEPYACSEWTSFLKARYHVDDDFYKNLGMKVSNIHCVVAGHDFSSLSEEEVKFETVRGQYSISLRAYLERLGSGVEGVVRCYTFPPLVDEEITPGAYFDYLVHKRDAKFAKIEPRLPRPIATRPPAPAAAPAAAEPAAAAPAAAALPFSLATALPLSVATAPAAADAALAARTTAPPAAKRRSATAAAAPVAAPAAAPAAASTKKRRRTVVAAPSSAAAPSATPASAAARVTAPLPGQDEAALCQAYAEIAAAAPKKQKGHTKSQVSKLGHNCFNKLGDMAFAADLTALAHRLYPGGVAGYDPSQGECMQPNWITRAPCTGATYPRFAFVNAVFERPEHHLFETTPMFSGIPVMAMNSDRGHSLRYGANGGVLGELEKAVGGRRGMTSVPLIADVVALVAADRGVDLASPVCASDGQERHYESAMRARKQVHAELKLQRRARAPRKAAEFFASSRDFDSNLTTTVLQQFRLLSAERQRHFSALATKATYYHTLAALEDTFLGVDDDEADDLS